MRKIGIPLTRQPADWPLLRGATKKLVNVLFFQTEFSWRYFRSIWPEIVQLETYFSQRVFCPKINKTNHIFCRTVLIYRKVLSLSNLSTRKISIWKYRCYNTESMVNEIGKIPLRKRVELSSNLILLKKRAINDHNEWLRSSMFCESKNDIHRFVMMNHVTKRN